MYGDGGFYFLQPVTPGASYGDGGFYFTQPVSPTGAAYAGWRVLDYHQGSYGAFHAARIPRYRRSTYAGWSPVTIRGDGTAKCEQDLKRLDKYKKNLLRLADAAKLEKELFRSGCIRRGGGGEGPTTVTTTEQHEEVEDKSESSLDLEEEESFFAKYKIPLIGASVAATALLVWKLVK